MRFLTTLLPYFFPTQTANFSRSDGKKTMVRLSACARFPARRILENSFFFLIRRIFIARYAEMCFLPLFLLLFKVFLPPFVFMR